MAQHASKRNRRSRGGKVQRRRVIGPVAAVGAFLATAMTPLATAPAAHADAVDSIIDPITNSIAGSLSGLIDPLAGLGAVPAVDPLPDLGLPTADLAASSNLGVGAADSALMAASDPSSAASSFDTMLQTLAQEWITSPSGAAYDAQLNALWHDLGNSGILIGNGANGTPDSTLAAANGEAGGLWFGNGGNGATDALGQGGSGGGGGVDGHGGKRRGRCRWRRRRKRWECRPDRQRR